MLRTAEREGSAAV